VAEQFPFCAASQAKMAIAVQPFLDFGQNTCQPEVGSFARSRLNSCLQPDSFKPEDWQSDHIEIESVDEDCLSFIISQLAAAETLLRYPGELVFLPDHN